jgi:cobalt-precorrin-5B (C1)-methyltransferase
MEEFIVKGGKKLRLGYTTGSCAAAAAKAAAYMLLTGRRMEQVELATPKGIRLTLPVEEIRAEADRVSCAVRKDGGDDPDVTTGSLIFAEVSRRDGTDIVIDGGKGVGRVTKPGLDQPVGAAAINSVPRQMIRESMDEVRRLAEDPGGLSAVISVPGGEALAKKTFNPRLGIVGGISIIGTTGIVEPMSEGAIVETIRVELRQRRESGAEYVLLTPGNYGSDFIRDGLGLDPAIGVQTSNFIGDAVDLCRELGFRGALLAGHVGKLVKIAGGMLNTHSQYGDCRMEILAAHAAAAGLRAERTEEILQCAACDDALRILREEGLYEAALARLTERVRFHLRSKAGESMEIGAILFSKVYGELGRTAEAGALLQKIVH